MSQRHPIQNGLTMFITTNTIMRSRIFGNSAAARIAIETLYYTQEFYPFFLFAFVIMPDHCHFLLRIPDRGSISKTMNLYKRSTSFAIGSPIWQKRFHMRMLTSGYEEVRTYIHLNPVRAGLCSAPEEYLWSSASGRWDVMDFTW